MSITTTSAPASAPPARDTPHSQRLILVTGWLLGAVLVLTAVFAARTLRESTRREWSEQLSTLSLLMSEHVSQTMFSAQTVLDSVGEEFNDKNLQSGAEFERMAATRQIHDSLVDRIRGNPIIDVASLVALDGRVLNFTRSFPAPDINLAERDYFRAHTSEPALQHYTSAPVRNKGNGKWVFYVSQPVRNSHGQLLGLMLVGVSVEWFSQFYRRMGLQLGDGASLSLWRSDFTLVTRWPFVDGEIGKVNRSTATHRVVGEQMLDHAVVTHDSLREFGAEQTVARMTAPRAVPDYPFIVTPAITEDIFLRNWLQSVRWIALTTGLCLLVLALSVRSLLRTSRRLHAELQERQLAQAALHAVHEQLESRVVERTAELTREMAERVQAEQELARVNVRVAEVSRRAGMAEVANSVLHNVGNVLTSVNVSVAVLHERLRDTPLQDLPRAAALLQAHRGDLDHYLQHDPQGRQLPDFLALLAQQWRHDHAALQAEAGHLGTSVQHIKDIVARQQSLSGVSGVNSMVDVPAVVDDVIAMQARALRHAGIEVHTDHVGPATWTGDRAKLTQILLNLVVNAEAALGASPPAAGPACLAICSTRRDDGSLGLTVQDNGPGMAPEVLDRLFGYGYTTKPDGHGYGLHSSALAAQEMGGNLCAASAGPGQGACFTLDLPDAALHAATTP